MSQEKILRFLDGLGFKDCKITTLSGGYVNNTFLLECPSGKKIIKEYLETRTLDQISGEVEFLKKLSLGKFPVPSPQEIGGKFIHEFEGSKIVFSKYMSGKINNADILNKGEIASALKIISKIHEYSKNIKLKNLKKRRDMFTFDFEDWLDTYIEGEIPQFFKETTSIKNSLKKRLEKEKSLFDIFPIHNDLVLQNLKFEENKLCAILDFDDFCEGTRISDFSNFALDACILKNGLDLERLKYCIEYYSSLQNLTEKEINIFPLVFLHRLVMYVYFFYYNFLSKKNKESLEKSEKFYGVLKNLIGKEIRYHNKAIRFEI